MSYTKTTWRNNQSPAINADNLNHIEQGIYDAHDGLASANNNMELMNNRLQAKIDDANSDISTLESNLAAETSARTQQDSVLSARMDTFTQLPSGSTSGDAELIDIRVGANGTTYSTAGDAIRTQVTNLKSEINAVADVTFSPNILDPSTIVSGKLITVDSNNELTYSDNSNYACALIPVEDGKTYTLTASNYYVIGFTSLLKKFTNLIDSTSGIHPASFTVSSASIKYAGISWRKDAYPIDTYMVVEGSTLPESFMPYGESYIDFTDNSVADITPKVLTDVADVFVSPNLLDRNDIVIGKFISTDSNDDLSYRDNADYSCALIPVENGKTYTITASNYYAIGFNSADHKFVNLIDNTSGTSPATFTVNNSSIVKVGISWRSDVYSNDEYMVVQGSTMPSEYMPHEETIVEFTDESIKNIKTQIKGKDYYVGYTPYNNTTRFQHLYDCLCAVALTSGDKTIHIKGGTYDLYTEMGGRTFIESKNVNDNTPYDSDVQPWLTDTKIVGEGKVVINFKLPNDISHDNYWLFSALNVMGNFEMENIQIFAENCRYAIHDESKSNYPNTIRKYRNCVISHRRTDSANNSQTMGCGFSERTRCEYKDLVLINNKGMAWSCHANAGTSLEFDNVVFRNEAVTSEVQADVMRIANNGMYQVPIRAILSNCFIGNGTLIMREENNDNRDSNTRVDLINTRIGNLDFRYTTNIYEPVTSYNTISGEVDVLVAPNA